MKGETMADTEDRFVPRPLRKNAKVFGIVDTTTGKFVLATPEQTASGNGPRWQTPLFTAADICAERWNKAGHQI